MTPDRKYLLERVDEAAVAQLYADGFEGLPLDQKILIWHLYAPRLPAVTSITTSATRTTSRCATSSRRSSLTRTASTPPTLAEIQRYTKLFWINTGPYNNLTARKFVLKCTPEAFVPRPSRPRRSGASIPARDGETSTGSRAAAAAVLRPRRRSDRHQQDAGRGQGHPRSRARTTSTSASRCRTSKASTSVSAEFAAGEAATAGSSKRSIDVGGKYDKEIRAIVGHLEAAIPLRDAARWPRRCAR